MACGSAASNPSFVLTCFAALITWFVPAVSSAQPVAPLSLEAAMDRAYAANPTIIAARLGRAINLAGLALASERPNPEVSVELEKELPKQAFTVAVPLELGGKRTRRIAVSQATLRVGEAELAAAMAQVRNDVRRAYFEALVAEERLTVLRELQGLIERARNAAQARFESGDAPRLEVLQADLALAAAQNEATAAEGVATAGRARLNALLGAPLEFRPALSTPLDPGAMLTSELLELARARNAELAVIDRRIDEQRARVLLARAMRVPDVTPAGAYTRDAEPEFSNGWRAAVAVTVPVFTGHKAAVQIEQATLDQLLAQREATLARIAGDVTAAAATAEAQRAAYLRYRDVILPQVQQVEQLAQESYQLGQTGLSELAVSLRASREIRLRAIDMVSQLHTALADLERAIGAPLP